MGEESNILSKEFWLSNEAGKICHKCEKMFSTIMRKHHCRYCGLIFCGKCTKLNQKFNHEIKLLRICDKCFILMKTQKLEPIPKIMTQSSGSFISDVDDTVEIDENVLDFHHELLPNKEPLLEICLVRFLNERCDKLIRENGLGEEWFEKVRQVVMETVETVCPSVKLRDDNMSLLNYIKIIKLSNSNNSCDFFQGSALLKSIANRKMDSSIDYPKLLFLDIKSSTFYEFITMNSLINEEKEFNKLFFKKITNISPNVILTAGTLSEKILQKLQKHNITAIINLKNKDFTFLARITQGKIINSINHACILENVLGKCRKMQYEYTNGQSLLYFTEIKDYTLGGCIIIESFQAKILSKIIKILIIEYRNAKLERNFLLQCGASIKEYSLIDLYSENLIVTKLVVCRENFCFKNINEIIGFYKEKDVCLGEYLNKIIKNSEEKCEKCGKTNQDHIVYYIKDQRVVKVSVFKAKAINDNDMFLSSNCRQCHKAVAPHLVSTALWEFSLHKFICNFFTEKICTSRCGHDLFHNAFKFQINGIQVLFSYEPFTKFSIIFPNSMAMPKDYKENLKVETLNDTQISAKCVLDSILNQGKSLVIKINQEMSIVDSNYDQLLILREKLFQNLESIYKLIKHVFEPNIQDFKNHLQIEVVRKGLFLECCKYKIAFKNIEESLKKLTPLKKTHSLLLPPSDPMIFDADFYIDEDLVDYFYKLQSGNLTLTLGRMGFVPVYDDDCGSFIAHSLASIQYYSEITEKITNTEGLLLNAQYMEWDFSTACYENYDFKNIDGFEKLYGDNLGFTITAYFPLQFEALRGSLGIDLEDFVVSLCKTVHKSEELGKSAAIFKRTYNHLFIIKIIEEREFRMFLSIAQNYFKHVCKSLFHSMPSILNRCLGAYRIWIKNSTTGKSRTEWCLVFENIGPRLQGPTLAYDLKGTTNKRRKVKDGDKKTKMDLNFVEDFSSLPLPISFDDNVVLEAAIINDTLFLSKQNVIDYSILLVISLIEHKICLAIIDYTQQYTFDKILESKYKSVIDTQIPTITHPDQYKTRFRNLILNHYFLAIE
ncbi:hypothetical protein SteCoe_7904 [Stentor coeruleus]|uniref:1-phosphatidylinositol-3-phosphate 5-kinase n=1 Tax=Stentor coeruleus TaxID=5963 RepID=A0A1R2CLC3_9CILI|nr:hypothetical protein SteCoe_7904 [Stentor coeruleus]